MKVAAEKNRRSRERRGRELENDERYRYLGYYVLRFCEAVKVSLEDSSLSVRWKRELDDDRHFQIDLNLITKDMTDAEIVKAERRVRLALGAALSGPVLLPPHHEDDDVAAKQLMLEQLPSAGPSI